MKKNIIIALPLVIICSTAIAQTAMHGNKVNPAPYTPAKGTAERKQIMDALRKEVKSMSEGLEVIFVVKSLKVQNGWAWAETLPQSKDGSAKYEPISGLLYRKFDIWYVQDIREYGDPDEADDRKYFKGLKSKFPALPMAILPKH